MVSMDQKEASYRGPHLRLFVRDVRDSSGKKRPITVRSWSTIMDVKGTLSKIIHVAPSALRLYYGPLLTSGGELPNRRTLHDAGIYRSGETLLLDIKGSAQTPLSPFSCVSSLRHSNDVCLSSSLYGSTPKALRNLVEQARRGFAVGLKPEFVLDGSGGTYFLHDARKVKIAVFKPSDEEPYAENNPRDYIQQADQSLSLRAGVEPGEACIREVAAYLLDHDGFSSVPMTTLAEARHPLFNTNGARLTVAGGGAAIGSHSINPNSPVRPANTKKAGSFQEFVHCECTMDDISPSKLSVEEVHKIAIHDIRIMNADRNSANLLVRRREDNSLELVPIDHGYCLRSVCDVSWMDWCWLDWPQMKMPLSEKHKKYIENLDIEADAQLLREQLNICEEAVDYFRASSSLLKAGVKAGLALYDIAIMCCRNDNLAEVPSMMEKLFSIASELSQAAVKNERWHHAAASRAIAEQLSPQRRRLSLQSDISTGSYLRRSASTAAFFLLDSSMPESLLAEALQRSGRDSPGMAHSSVSDSSSDSGDAAMEKEECECEEWAAGVIAEMNMDQIALSVPRRSTRSGSIASDDASSDSILSSSPKGFWIVPPGSSLSTASDDGSWSPKTIPRSSFVTCEVETSPDCSSSSSLPPSPKNKTPAVTFADESSGPFLPPATVSIAPFKRGSDVDVDLTSLTRSDSGMTRSKSYSALPGPSKHGSSSRLTNPFTEEYENYRKYFHKFIDLVIVRETTAALGQTQK